MNLNYDAELLEHLLTNKDSVVVADIETDGLLDMCTKVHCIAYQTYGSGQTEIKDPHNYMEAIEAINSHKLLVMHNGHGFDEPALKKLGHDIKPIVIDTLVLSRYLFPNINDIDSKEIAKGRYHLNPKMRRAPHSLGAWGVRLGFLKGNFGDTTDWAEWSPEMSEYCGRDVDVNVKLLEFLLEKVKSWNAFTMEQKVSSIIQRQTQAGWQFDVRKAEELYGALITRKRQIETELRHTFPQRLKAKNPGKVFTPKRDNKAMGYSAGVPCTKVHWVEFNPSSDDHIRYELERRYGFKSWEKTGSGKGSVKGEILDQLAEIGYKGQAVPEAELLADYKNIIKIAGMIGSGDRSWLQLVKDGRIHGNIITCGAATARMSHNNPNVAQVPSGKVRWGKECRELFIAPEGYSVVGADASGLEARCLAHYLARYDGGKFTRELLEGDIHTANQKAAGLPSRDLAKTFFYAFMYGAGNGKLGSFLGGSFKEGKKLREKFLRNFPALGKLSEAVVRNALKNGYLRTIDGRHLPIRSTHSALNTLLQSCGAIIMKRALVIAEEKLSSRFNYGTDYVFIGNIHDELQMQVRNGLEEEVGKILVEGMVEAGEYYNFRCPLDGEYQYGSSWAETH